MRPLRQNPRSVLVVIVQDVIDGYVDRDIAEPYLLAESRGDLALDVPGDLVRRVAVADRDGQVHDRGAAEHADGGVRVVTGSGFLGQCGKLALGAAAQGDPDPGDHPGSVAG